LALRGIQKQMNKASVLVKGPQDPPPIRRDILVQKIVEYTVPSSATPPTSFTNASIYALLDPGTTPFFTHMRVIKVAVFGVPSTSSSVSQPVVHLSINYDGAFFMDRGVGTARTANLHVRLPELIRETWISTTDTTGVCVVGISGGSTGTTVQFTIEVRADTSADS